MITEIKDMKLIFSRPNSTQWKKVVEDLDGNLIYEELNAIFDEPTSEEFDAWEAQTLTIPHWNIVEIERFI